MLGEVWSPTKAQDSRLLDLYTLSNCSGQYHANY